MSTACGRLQGEGVWLMWTHVDNGEEVKNPIFVNVIDGWPLKESKIYFFPSVKAKFHVLKSLKITSSPWKAKFRVLKIASPGRLSFMYQKLLLSPGKAKFHVLKSLNITSFPPGRPSFMN